MVAERGMSLSGGQKQRISIARAVIKPAGILIFDDSTSALDLKTEANLQEALRQAKPECTKIMIAQRIASVRQADRIVVLHNGCIEACGTHEALLQSCQTYQDIYHSQIGKKVKAMGKMITVERNIPGANRHNRFVEVEHAEDVHGTLQRILTYFAREKMLVFSMLVIVIFGTLCGVYAPSLQSKAIDMIAGTVEGSLTHTLLFMLTVYLLYSGSQLLQGLCSANLSQRIVRRMREELFGKIVDLPVQYLDNHSHGDMMSRMTNDIENISTTVSQSLPSLFSGVMTILGTVAIMLWYCWQLALLSCITVLLTVLATKVLSKQVRKFSRRRQSLLGMLNGTVEEMISGYRTVVAYNHQKITIEEFCATSDSLTKAGIRTDVFSGVMGPIMNCIGNLGFVIIAAFGGFSPFTA